MDFPHVVRTLDQRVQLRAALQRSTVGERQCNRPERMDGKDVLPSISVKRKVTIERYFICQLCVVFPRYARKYHTHEDRQVPCCRRQKVAL